MQYKCVDCGAVFSGSFDSCPNCGCPRSACSEYNQPTPPPIHAAFIETVVNENPQPEPPKFDGAAPKSCGKKDWANYVYECGVLYWETFSQRYATFTGRASRTEFWTFWIISAMLGLCTGIGVLIILLPAIAVSIRRMHDINKCGWWSICPVASVFLNLKKSDPGFNKYGVPHNYSHIFS